MFPLEAFYNSCYGSEPPSRKARLERKLKFLKRMKKTARTLLPPNAVTVPKAWEQP
jgi:hypothetical protein